MRGGAATSTSCRGENAVFRHLAVPLVLAAVLVPDAANAESLCGACGQPLPDTGGTLLPIPETSSQPAASSVLPPQGLQPGDTYHLVFVTSFPTKVTNASTVPPPSSDMFGSMPAADWVVTMAAFDAGLLADWNGLDLVYKAILSTLTEVAHDHVPITAPVYNTRGELVATDYAEFWSYSHRATLAYDEYGSSIPGDQYGMVKVWTGTWVNGNYWNPSCNYWTSSSGSNLGSVGNAASVQQWAYSQACRCDSTARLYGVSPPLTFVPEPSGLLLLGAGALLVSGFAWLRRKGRGKA
jgi:hypothetical protein